MNEKFLIVKGIAGLGNRLFTLCAAIEYAKLSKRTLLVDWSDGQFCPDGVNAFTEYFDLKDVDYIKCYNEINLIELKTSYPILLKTKLTAKFYDLYSPHESKWFKIIPSRMIPKGSFRKIFGYWRLKRTSLITQADLQTFVSFFKKNDFEYGSYLSEKRSEDLVFYVDYCPKFNHNILLENIKLKPHIQVKVDTLVEKYKLNQKCVGIHIRSTDKTHPQNLMLVITFIKKRYKDTRIFLATDNKHIENLFNEHFSSLITHEKFIPNVTTGGIHHWAQKNNNEHIKKSMFEDAILDMFLLSKCDHLIYQGNSTFSIISNLLRNKKDSTDWLQIKS